MNALNVESEIRRIPQNTSAGIVRSHPIALGDFTLGAGTTIPAAGSGVVGRTLAATALNVISWNATADNGDTIALDWTLPLEFRPSSFSETTTTPTGELAKQVCNIELWLKIRLTDTTGSATANADLKMQVTPLWHNTDGTALGTLGAAIQQTVGAIDYAEASEEGFVWYRFDITGAMTAAQRNALRPLTTLQLTINPHEAVGTALRLDLAGAILVELEHLTAYDPTLRNPT